MGRALSNPPVIESYQSNERSPCPFVGFEVGVYDSARPLVIDPTLAWNTFLGSADNEEGETIALDASGNIDMVGNSQATWGTPVNPFAGGYDDAFVAKIVPSAPPPPNGEANRIAVGLGGPAGAGWLAASQGRRLEPPVLGAGALANVRQTRRGDVGGAVP